MAARRRLLDEPERHRALLRRVAVGRIVAAVLGGLPLALMAAELWTSPSLPAVLLAGSLHALSGYAGGLGYAALFGLLAVRIAERGGPGPVARALQACGQRSLSCYLAQSVAFVALLPAWTLGLGEHARLWQAALRRVRRLAGDPAGRGRVRPGRLPRPGRGAAAPADLRPDPRDRPVLTARSLPEWVSRHDRWVSAAEPVGTDPVEPDRTAEPDRAALQRRVLGC